MKQRIVNLGQENKPLSVIITKEIMMYEIKLSNYL